jgi:hypothetical protein
LYFYIYQKLILKIIYAYRLHNIYITCKRDNSKVDGNGGVLDMADLSSVGDILSMHHPAPGRQEPETARRLPAIAAKPAALAR